MFGRADTVCYAYDGRYVSSKGRGNAYGSIGWAKEGIRRTYRRPFVARHVTSRRAGGVKGGGGEKMARGLENSKRRWRRSDQPTPRRTQKK